MLEGKLDLETNEAEATKMGTRGRKKKNCLLRINTKRRDFSSLIILQVQKEDHTKITKR